LESDAKLKQELRPLQITAAKEVCMKGPVLSYRCIDCLSK
jgi:hypothetical protein